jgi:hypothetical protein
LYVPSDYQVDNAVTKIDDMVHHNVFHDINNLCDGIVLDGGTALLIIKAFRNEIGTLLKSKELYILRRRSL